MSVVESYFCLYFSRLKAMFGSGNDSTRIRKAKSRYHFIFHGEMNPFFSRDLLAEESRPSFYFYFSVWGGIVHASNSESIQGT